MPQHMHETASTQFVQVGDLRVAYRRFGKRGALPLLLINYFAANMDDLDPKITKGFVGFCRALDLNSFDVVGFSLGGMIAQQLAFEFPNMARRIVLLGTGPRGGEDMTFTELTVDELDDPASLLMNAFFTPSDASGRTRLSRTAGSPRERTARPRV